MRKPPEINTMTNRKKEIRPRPSVYEGRNVLICVFAPCKWRKKLFTTTAVLDLSDVGIPLLRKEFANELFRDFKFSMYFASPVCLISFISFIV